MSNEQKNIPVPPAPEGFSMKTKGSDIPAPSPVEKINNTTIPIPPAIKTDSAERAMGSMGSNVNNPIPTVDNNGSNNKEEKKHIPKGVYIFGAITGGLILLVLGFFVWKNNIGDTVNDRSSELIQDERIDGGEVYGEFNSKNGVAITGKCSDEYNKLLEINGFDFDKYCTNKKVRGGEYDPNAVPQKKKNLVLIFDASGSMAAKIGGKRKIDIAKEAVWKFMDQINGEENLNLSVVVYGHKGSNKQSDKQLSCAGIEEVYYLGKVDAGIAKAKLNKFDATGWTPIAGSFQKAKEILKEKNNDENFILLVSDGKEMCEGDPVATIRQLKEDGLNVKADVIGFDVGGADEAQLKAVAEAGDGDYFSVSTAVDLENAFAKHKEMLNEADFKIGRTVEQLYDISFVINNYNQCRVMLKKEQAAMMLDIHASKLAGERCEDSVDRKYEERLNKIKNEIERIYINDKLKFDALK